MLTDEVSQTQEVRYCLKSLREQMAARKNCPNRKPPANGYTVCVIRQTSPTEVVTNGNRVGTQELETHVKESTEDSAKLSELNKRLRAQIKETERRHQKEKDCLQAESEEFRRRLDERSERLELVEGKALERGQKVEELERLLGGMQLEAAGLRDKMAAIEAELLLRRAAKEEEAEKQKRIGELEKELARLNQKIPQLDDMLKCQQRKVRNMIEQLQNSRTVIQERDRVIRDLEEKVAFLEAENTEMRDQMEYLMEGGQIPTSTKETKDKPQIIYSRPITPSSTDGNKSLPLIRVIEIQS
ncbi:hypothetical protein DPEC_G00203710 [Dallia pectoralis]|uniref:Uncharacterized protein n=1 Tax=Dallia pectoralis TaxID=75939 RepID=A0ACC2G9U8_DALPE|nr:hypothetical protein DPEC_G00203710 [Dallia pectoralis]